MTYTEEDLKRLEVCDRKEVIGWYDGEPVYQTYYGFGEYEKVGRKVFPIKATTVYHIEPIEGEK